MRFPIDLSAYKPLSIPLTQEALTPSQRVQLEKNIQLVRDAIVFFTAYAGAKGLSGHTGGAYDIVPEALIVDGFMRGNSDRIVPVFYDEAGHRVALQYVLAALDERVKGMQVDDLLSYRQFGKGLYGHPERNDDRGIHFSSGRLGHLWPFVNGVALAHPGRKVVLFGSDGSQQEGTDAEAARFAVAQGLEVAVLIDDNNVTISGHPHEYMNGFDIARTLEGHGLRVSQGDGEHLDSLYERVREALTASGPVAVVNKRPMAPGIAGVEGLPKGHDVVPVNVAVAYLEARGHTAAVSMLNEVKKVPPPVASYKGSTTETGTNRTVFGEAVADLIERIPTDQRARAVRVFDNDLAGSCGITPIAKRFPDLVVSAGIMERQNFSAAAGFGAQQGQQGVYATFSAFLEMLVSEITMARMNHANVLAHFSHAGVDWMADNNCHLGVNNLFADNGFEEDDPTRLYFPADASQMRAVVNRIFNDRGLRFVFSTRSSVPYILDELGKPFFDPTNGYQFVPGRDELIREGTEGYIVSYGDSLHRCLDAVERLRERGIDVGLINKPTLNVVDEDMVRKVGEAPFVLVVETLGQRTGLGARYGTWLAERDLNPTYSHMGVHRAGAGGIYEQIPHQGLDAKSIVEKVEYLLLHNAHR